MESIKQFTINIFYSIMKLFIKEKKERKTKKFRYNLKNRKTVSGLGKRMSWNHRQTIMKNLSKNLMKEAIKQD